MKSAEGRARWLRIERDGTEWEIRVTAEPATGSILEFVCVDGSRQPRRVAVEPGSFPHMDEAALSHAYIRARPIGGDYYGRPGKRMNDVA